MSLLKSPKERKECHICKVTQTSREGGVCVRCENNAKVKKVAFDCLLCDSRTSRSTHICSRHSVSQIKRFIESEKKPVQNAEEALSRVIDSVEKIAINETNPLNVEETQAAKRISETIQRLKEFYEGSTNASTIAEWEIESNCESIPEEDEATESSPEES